MTVAPRRLSTTYSELTWSSDGRTITKVRSPSHDARRRFRYELKVNMLLRDRPPPVPTAVLLGHDIGRRSLTFDAIAGDPLGPKYPTTLGEADLDDLLALADGLSAYEPRRRWLRRLDSVGRIDLAQRHGLLDQQAGAALRVVARRVHTRYHFCHGDITARNVLRHRETGEAALIDWEWAGLYPSGYERAFLWYSLVDVPEARQRVEAHAAHSEAFLLSALLVTLWHLQWYLPGPFRGKHLETKEQLVRRLLG